VREIDRLERETIKRVAWRLMPLLMLGIFCAYVDRVNVGMAATTMNKQLGFSNAVFGFGAGLFFFGYFLFEVPSNLILDKTGARRWLARIMVTWGIVAGLTAFVWNDWSFYGVRFVLGLAEAGFFPGAMLYLTWWFPSYYRSRMVAIFCSAQVFSAVVGPAIGGLLLQMDGMLGLRGWQWLFLIEAVPSVIMAVVTWQLLTDKPTDAAWLRPDQKAWLIERLAAERAQREAIRKFSLAEAFYNPKIWILTVAFFGQNVSIFTLMFFTPLIVQGLGVSTHMIGLVSGLPYVFALVAMNFWGWHSDHTGERTWHLAGAYFLCAVGMAGCVLIGVGHPGWMMVALIVATSGVWCGPPAFWALPSALLTGTAAAAGFALISSVGNLGGWFGPSAFGLLKDATGSDSSALFCLSLAPVVSAILVIAVGHDSRLERIPPRPAAPTKIPGDTGRPTPE
jgi:MFS family permease